MKIRNADRRQEEVELEMTPMIDIVFQLLVFFIMSFKIVTQEGDFNIKMPQGASAGEGNFEVPMKVALRADGAGNLANILVGEGRGLGTDFNLLRAEAVAFLGNEVGLDTPSTLEVEIDADYNLKYSETVKALTALSGEKKDGVLVPLFEKIKFKPKDENRTGP